MQHEVPHHFVLLLRWHFFVLYDRAVDCLHLLHDQLLHLRKGVRLVADLCGQLVGLQVNCELVDVRLDSLVLLADVLQYFVVLLLAHKIL